MLTKVLEWACRVGTVGALCAAVKYKYVYEAARTDAESTRKAVANFSCDSRREFYDVAVVGGGIVGVATAREILRQFPKKRVILVEKEPDVAQHQSSHNSGVVHAGMYYPPNSLMARLCPRGHDLMMSYCKQNNLPCERVGKLIVATEDKEIPTIETLYKQGMNNGVRELQLLRGEEEIKKVEPNVRGICALYSPDTAIADFSAVARHMLKELLTGKHGRFECQFQFEALDFVGLSVQNQRGDLPSEMVLIRGREEGQLGPEKTLVAKNVITCCGLSNDLLANRSGRTLSRIGNRVLQTFSFRGRYYQLRPEAHNLVSMNVYPAPDSSKGLSVGVHFTPTVDERRGRQIIVGPGSAVATHRYGYSPYCVDLEYCWNSFFSKGGWVSLGKNIFAVTKTFVVDINRNAFLQEARKLIPSLKDSDLTESFCGVMGVAVGENGELDMDLSMEFSLPRTTLSTSVNSEKVIEVASHVEKKKVPMSEEEAPLILNVRNAPSPAATACMAIAEDIVAASKAKFRW